MKKNVKASVVCVRFGATLPTRDPNTLLLCCRKQHFSVLVFFFLASCVLFSREISRRACVSNHKSPQDFFFVPRCEFSLHLDNKEGKSGEKGCVEIERGKEEQSPPLLILPPPFLYRRWQHLR